MLNESSGILLLPQYLYGSLGKWVLGVASPQGLPDLKLIRVVGLSKRPPGLLSTGYHRYDIVYQVLFLLVFFSLFALLLGGRSTALIRLIASLLVLGLVLIALTYGVIVPEEQLSGMIGLSGGASGTLILYGDRDKIVNINIKYSGNCTIPYNISLAGPENKRSYYFARNDTIILPRLGDPGIYKLLFTPLNNNNNCSTVELLRSSIDASFTMAIRKWSGYKSYLGYSILLIIAPILLLIYFKYRGGASSLGLASLISTSIYLEIISLFMIVLYSFLYAVVRSSCKLWGGCIISYKVDVLGYLARPPQSSIVVYLVYSVVVASALFGLLLEIGVDKRLLLSGLNAVKLNIYKIVIGLLNIVLPLTLVAISVEWLADPASFLKLAQLNIIFIVKLLVVLTSIVLPVYSTTILLSIMTRRFSYGLLTGLMIALGFIYLAPPSIQPYNLMINYLFIGKHYTYFAIIGYSLIGIAIAAISILLYMRGDLVE